MDCQGIPWPAQRADAVLRGRQARSIDGSAPPRPTGPERLYPRNATEYADEARKSVGRAPARLVNRPAPSLPKSRPADP